MQRQFQQFVVFFVPLVQFLDRMVAIPAACRSLARAVHTCADRGDLTGTVLGMVLDAPVIVQQQVPWLEVAQCLVRRWTHVMHHSGWLLEEFVIFYMRVLTRLRSSIHVLLFSSVVGTVSTTVVACSILVLLVLTHLALCSHDCRRFLREVHSRCFSCS